MEPKASLPDPGVERPDPWTLPRHRLSSAVFRALQAQGFSGTVEEVEANLSEPPEGKGDLALPTFRWAKALGTSPPALAQTLCGELGPVEGFQEISADGGFLNARLDLPSFLLGCLAVILRRGDHYGEFPQRPGLVCIEHTSANPTGSLHVGRARNSLLGDSYARLLRARGDRVTTQFYVDDVGRQAATLVWIWEKPLDSWPPEVRAALPEVTGREAPPGVKPDAFYGAAYVPAFSYIKSHPEAEREVNALTERLEKGEGDLALYRRVPRAILSGIEASLARLSVRFDEFVWESDFVRDGSVERVIERLGSSPVASRAEDGALRVDGRPFGLPEEDPWVYATRSDGTHLYPTRDVAYHETKFRRFDRVIDVLGQDHALHVKGLNALLAALGEERRPEALLYGYVNLPEGKMTTRGGRVVLLDDLLDEGHRRALEEVRRRHPELTEMEADSIAESLGCAAVRYHLLRIQPDKPIVFRWDEALSFEGKSGPFVEYSHARAVSLLRKFAATGTAANPATVRVPAPAELPGPADPRELALARTLSRLPGTVDRASRDGAVHLVALYAHETAERFNEFYQALRVLDAEPPWRDLRLSLVAATRQVLANSLRLLGLETMERM